jgi:hypothetical protein
MEGLDEVRVELVQEELVEEELGLVELAWGLRSSLG